MKLSRSARIIDRVAIAAGLANFLLFLVIPVQLTNSNLIGVLVALFYILLSGILIFTWGIFRKRSFFATWVGWVMVFTVFFICSLPSQGVWQIENERVSLFFTLGYLVMGWTVGISAALLVFQRDIGVPVIAWISLIVIWVIFITWRIQGNLVEQAFFAITSQDIVSPLWWLYPFLCGLGWLLMFSIASFIFHTLKILHREFFEHQGESGAAQ